MIRSMTGFGRYELVTPQYKIIVEIKSVNHRYLDLSIKMPRILNCFETDIRNLVKEDLQRGKVDMYISIEYETNDQVDIKYNDSIAREYVRHINNMSEEFQLGSNLTADSLARFPEVFTMDQKAQSAEEMWPDIETAVRNADKAIVSAREKEGAQLKTDLSGKLEHLSSLVDIVCEKAPQSLADYRQRLWDRVQEILVDTAVDDSRIAAEVTIYADKVCVDEEMVRLRTHIGHMQSELEKGVAVGRKLDFLAQEMNREANTTLSKVNDVTLTDTAIDMKTEIEKIREQVQNIE